MGKINFVPDDYVQNTESRRANLIYLLLFLIVMTGLFGSFLAIKIRQKLSNEEEKVVDKKMTRAQQQLKQLEQLEEKRQIILKTAITTSQLLEPVPRSVLLASLTNNLPKGVSFLCLDIIQKESKRAKAKPETKYQQQQQKQQQGNEPKISKEKTLQTHINIEGIAGSDLQVAAYIERLTNSRLLEDVALVESKEYKIPSASNSINPGQEASFRQFKLTAMLRMEAAVGDEDIERIMNSARQMKI